MKSSNPKYVCDRILVLQILRQSRTNHSEAQSTRRYIQGETVNKIPLLKHLSASHHNDSIQRHPPLPFIRTMSDPRAIAREREREHNGGSESAEKKKKSKKMPWATSERDDLVRPGWGSSADLRKRLLEFTPQTDRYDSLHSPGVPALAKISSRRITERNAWCDGRN